MTPRVMLLIGETSVLLVSAGAMNTMSGLAVGLTTLLASLRPFGNERAVFWRESASGVNKFAYFLGAAFSL